MSARGQVALAAALLVAALAGTAFVAPAGRGVPAASAEPQVLHAAAGWLPAADAAAPSPTAALVAVAACGALALLAGRRSPATAGPSRARPAGRQLVPVAAFESELGVQEPVGFWDPLGFSADGDAAAFRRRRSVELKHGRISMLATMGYITPELTGKFPGYLSPSAGLKFADIPNGLAAISKVPALGWAQVVAYAGFVELSAGSEDWKIGTPGDFGFKVITSSDPAEKRKKLSAELANGRLAMVAIIGMFFQDGLTGSAWGDWALYTASPLRARDPKVAREFFGGGSSAPAYKVFDPATELGVQDPVGFWDPLGFAGDRSEATFKRRRSVELKHGRVAMAATIGYIVPEYFKFPGYLSPSLELKFSDVPNGLAALSKVPGIGWVQIVFFAGIVEGAFGVGEYKTGNPGEYGWKVITSSDPAAKAKKLGAELANGRLAMMAIIGMFFQDGLTGSAWGDWALYTASPLRAFESELGVQAPTGFWDPLGFTKDGDVTAFKRRRVSEIKHGRIAMLATMGYVTPALTGKFPGYLDPASGLKFADVPNGLAAISKVPALGWAQIVLYCLYCEATGGFGYNGDNQMKSPGDCGWKPPLLATNNADLKKKRLNSELANGRLAMMAIIGMFFQDGLTGSAWGDWALYTASPLRAFENELGVQDPVGFWDPLGFTADGDLLSFKRRRCVELKHGRISMLATMGYITPEITGKFPGYLSPSLGLKFTDIPSGLAAVTKIPALGWVQIFAYAGFCELTGPTTRAANREDYASVTPGDYGFKVLTSSDPAELRKKLSAEIANGRLAMMAIIGMFFQDGLTGSAWGDWALYTASPLRAASQDDAPPPPPPPFNPATQIGAMPPLGFFDPAGFSKVGDKDGFRNLRASELKHGRVAMMAAVGAVAQHFIKFPGFEGVPSGLGAVAAAPGTYGFVALFLVSGALELAVWTQDPAKEVGDFGDPLGLGMYDPDTRAREINNGRFAMFAAIGIIAAELLTGKDAVEQFGG